MFWNECCQHDEVNGVYYSQGFHIIVGPLMHSNDFMTGFSIFLLLNCLSLHSHKVERVYVGCMYAHMCDFGVMELNKDNSVLAIKIILPPWGKKGGGILTIFLIIAFVFLFYSLTIYNFEYIYSQSLIFLVFLKN